MSLKNIDKCFDLIEKNFSFTETGFSNPKKEVLIKEAEKILGLKFPLSYKTFIRKVGHGGPGGAFMPGIYTNSLDELKSGGVVYGVLNDRKTLNYPDHLISIYDVGEGTTYCLDTSQFDQDDECPVVAWPIGGYEETRILKIVSKDFGEFFLKKVEGQIENKKDECDE